MTWGFYQPNYYIRYNNKGSWNDINGSIEDHVNNPHTNACDLTNWDQCRFNYGHSYYYTREAYLY